MDIPDTRLDGFLPLDEGDRAEIQTNTLFNSLLGSEQDLGLTQAESQELLAYERSLVILGPSGGAVLMCPGNQENLRADQMCPYASKCPLLRAKKAPEGKLCPIERKITEERFGSWCRTIGQEPDLLTEDARATVSTPTYIDIQEQRSTHILATGEAARLTPPGSYLRPRYRSGDRALAAGHGKKGWLS